MKKLIALCAVLGFTAQANAQVEMNHSGGFRLQYMATDNSAFADTGTSHDWAQRFQWNMGIKAGENMNVHAKLVHAASWGGNADQYPGDGSVTPTGTQVINSQKDSLIVNELKGIWTISDEMTLSYGRGSYTMADGTVVAANEWEQVQKAFDGGLFAYDHEMAKFNVFAVRGANGTGTRQYGDFMGLSVDFKALPEFLKMANLHYISVKRDAGSYLINGAPTALSEEDTTRMGLTVGGDAAGVDYRATYAMYSGETISGATTTDVDSNMLDAEVGYSMPDTMNLRVSVLYHTDSGQDSSTDNTKYSGFHYDTHNNAGLMDVLTWGNLTYMKAAVTLDPTEDVSVGLAYYQFTSTEETDTNGTNFAVTTSDDIGTEMDLWVTKRYSSNFAITGWYGMFAAGDKQGTSPEDMSQIYFAGNYTF